MAAPVNAEVAAAFGRFFFGGRGPSHAALTAAFAQSGYSADDPSAGMAFGDGPNKQQRVQTVIGAASRRPDRARELIEALLTQLRVAGAFDPQHATVYDADTVRAAQRALHAIGWLCTEDGHLSLLGLPDLATGGRNALDEQLDRLRRATDDPALMLGTAKDLLEAVAKFVLEELSAPVNGKADFGELFFHVRDRLGIHPKQVALGQPGAETIKKVLQSSWTLAESVNDLRNLQGTGHGRTLPTGVTPEMALFVVREACSLAEYILTTLDRQIGRQS